MQRQHEAIERLKTECERLHGLLPFASQWHRFAHRYPASRIGRGGWRIAPRPSAAVTPGRLRESSRTRHNTSSRFLIYARFRSHVAHTLDNVSLTFHLRQRGRVPLKEFVVRQMFRKSRNPITEVKASVD